MSLYNVTFSLTFGVEADSKEEAELVAYKKATEMPQTWLEVAYTHTEEVDLLYAEK